VAAFGDEGVEPFAGLRDGVRGGDADGVEAVRLRLLGDTKFYLFRMTQKSRSP
jgi:hypothetical protein